MCMCCSRVPRHRGGATPGNEASVVVDYIPVVQTHIHTCMTEKSSKTFTIISTCGTVHV